MNQSEKTNKLAKRLTIALVIMGIAAIALAVTLFLTIPEDVKTQFMEKGWHEGHKMMAGNGAPALMHAKRHHKHGILLIVIAAVIIIGIVKHKAVGYHMFRKTNGGESAMEILRKEYANGDISKEDYLARKEVLERGEGGEV